MMNPKNTHVAKRLVHCWPDELERIQAFGRTAYYDHIDGSAMAEALVSFFAGECVHWFDEKGVCELCLHRNPS